MTKRLAVFLAMNDIVSPNIDGIVLGIVAKANRDNMQISLLIGCCQPAQPLAL